MVKNLIRKGRAVLNSRQTTIVSAAFVIMGMYCLSAVLGFIRNRLLVAVFFPQLKWQTDVYFAAFRIPDIIFQILVVSALGSAFIPLFSGLVSQKKENAAWATASNLLGTAIVVFLILAAVVALLAPLFSKLIAPGFSLEELSLLVRLMRLLLLAQGFFVISAVLTGILQSFQRFLLPALSPVVYNLGLILGIVSLSKFFGIYGPVFGALIGAFFHFLIQIPAVVKLGLKFSSRVNFGDPAVLKVARLMLPRALALGVEQFYLTFALALASGMPTGRVALFTFAQQIVQLPVNIFGSSFGQASLPALSSEVARRQLARFKKTFILTLRQILYLAVPAGAVTLVLRIPLVRLLFGARGFTWEDTLITAKTVALFSLAVFGQAATHLLIRGFYALGDTKTPLYSVSLTAAINIALSFLLTRIFNVYIPLGRISTFNSPVGLALAFSLANIFHFLLLSVWLDKRVGHFDRQAVLLPAGKIFFAGSFMALSLWAPMKLLDQLILDTTRTLNLIILTATVSLIGFSAYFFLTRLLKLEEVEILHRLFKKIGRLNILAGKQKEIVGEATLGHPIP
jgi:putative peptidoglycan lipid II flippase